MTKQLFLILLILSSAASVFGQNSTTLRGMICDSETGHPIPGGIVKTRKAFTTANNDGRFSLTLKVPEDSVSFRAMGYAAVTLPITADLGRVALTRKPTQLADVIVQAPDIYAKGDTLVFNVSKYANATDNAIKDVIKRLPGIKVEDDGTIKYQGKAISKFYLDGNDFLGGQYDLATSNISHKDVKAVEVMENHQPVKALDGIEFPEEAGINLKLREDARSRWVGVLTGEAGVAPLQGSGSLYAMRLAPKVQNIITLKADNTGWDPANAIREHEVDLLLPSTFSQSPWPRLINADAVSSPLPDKRTRQNLSSIANSITAWRCGDNSMRLKLNYMSDQLDYSTTSTTQYLNSSIPLFTQSNTLRTQNRNLSAQFNSEINKPGFYLVDRLNIGMDHTNSLSAITGTTCLNQSVKHSNLSAVNDFKLVKRTDRNVVTVTSRNSVASLNDKLIVTDDNTISQTINPFDVYSATRAEFGAFSRFWKYYLTTGANLNYHSAASTLAGLPEYSNATDYSNFISNIYATPRADYERSNWRLSLQVPLKWLHYTISGARDYLTLSPRITLRHQLSARTELSAAVYAGNEAPQPYLFTDAPVMANYRNIIIPTSDGKTSLSCGSSLSLRYRNPVNSLFANMAVSCFGQNSTMMANNIFLGDLIITRYDEQLSKAEGVQLSAGISKGLAHSKMVIGCDLAASTSSASSMRNGTIVPYRQTGANAKPYLRGSVCKWLAINYEAELSSSTLNVVDSRSQSLSMRHNMFASIIPHEKLCLTLGAEHFTNRMSNNSSASMLLLDASAAFKVSDKLRVSLTATNLCNTTNYRYTTYGSLSRTDHSFALRPRTILLSAQLRF